MSDFKPFENDEQSTNVGPGEGLTFENGLVEENGIVVYGDFVIDVNTNPEELDQIINLFTKIKEELNVFQKNCSNGNNIKP